MDPLEHAIGDLAGGVFYVGNYGAPHLGMFNAIDLRGRGTRTVHEPGQKGSTPVTLNFHPSMWMLILHASHAGHACAHHTPTRR